MGWACLLVLVAALAAQIPQSAAPAQTAELPPPYPRPGTTKIFENEVVAVWDVSWLKQKYPLHTHRYDLVGMSYAEGDRIITQGDAPGRLVNTKAWVFQTNRANVTHVEEGASDPPMRAVQIELKNPAPRGTAGDGPDGLRQVAGAPASENNRAAVWAVAGGTPVPSHRHVGDAVEMVFDAATPPAPKVTFVPAGTVHAGPAAPDGGRAFIFELK
jgi:hypothetical protein